MWPRPDLSGRTRASRLTGGVWQRERTGCLENMDRASWLRAFRMTTHLSAGFGGTGIRMLTGDARPKRERVNS